MNEIKEIVGDLCDRYIVNIELISFNKKKQKVKWPFKLVQFYLVSSSVQLSKFLMNIIRSILRATGTTTIVKKTPKGSGQMYQ